MNQGSEKYFGKSWSYFTARETSVFGLDRKALSFKNRSAQRLDNDRQNLTR